MLHSPVKTRQCLHRSGCLSEFVRDATTHCNCYCPPGNCLTLTGRLHTQHCTTSFYGVFATRSLLLGFKKKSGIIPRRQPTVTPRDVPDRRAAAQHGTADVSCTGRAGQLIAARIPASTYSTHLVSATFVSVLSTGFDAPSSDRHVPTTPWCTVSIDDGACKSSAAPEQDHSAARLVTQNFWTRTCLYGFCHRQPHQV